MKIKEEINACTTNKLLLDIHSLIHESCVTIEYEKNIEKCKALLSEADMLLHELIERDVKNKILSEPDSTKYKDAEIIKGLLKWIKAQNIEWDDDLDIIFSPGFNLKEFKPIEK